MSKLDGFTFTGTADRVVDGDTFHLRLDLGFHVQMVVPVRLRGVDTPELSTEAGKAARNFAQRVLRGSPIHFGPPTPLRVQTYKGQTFARWVADVTLLDAPGARSLAEVLVAAGHARRVNE